MIPPLKTTAAMFFALGAVVGALKAPTVVGKYPWDWVPMWDGKRESVLLNAANIVSITPKFRKDVPIDKLKNIKNSKAEYLEVRMVDGTTCEIYEDFDEFFSRIRNAQQ